MAQLGRHETVIEELRSQDESLVEVTVLLKLFALMQFWQSCQHDLF